MTDTRFKDTQLKNYPSSGMALNVVEYFVVMVLVVVAFGFVDVTSAEVAVVVVGVFFVVVID